jgi:hypothetical protein
MRAAPAAFGPHVVVAAVVLEHQRAFDVLRRRRDFLEQRAVGHRHDTGEVVLEPHDVGVLPAAVDHVMAAVVVTEDELVDRLRTVVELVDQRLADQVAIRPLGPVCDGDAYTT